MISFHLKRSLPAEIGSKNASLKSVDNDVLSNLCFRNVSSGDTGNRVRRFFYGPRPETFLQLAKSNPPVIARTNGTKQSIKSAAFSLVEMLMALLVASLLLAALAPVITKRNKEPDIKIMAESAQYDKDSVVQIFKESGTFNVPTDVNSVKVTMLGGGGAGGDAFWGVKEFSDATSIKEWKVPDGVTRLRVYMVGGGGGGASGGVGSATAYGSFSQATETSKDFLTAGSTTWTIPDGAKIPELDYNCKSSGTEGWSNALDDADTNIYKSGEYLIKVTACGGGGGAGGNNYPFDHGDALGRGGNGGYIEAKTLTLSSDSLALTIGGGGGGGAYRPRGVSGGLDPATDGQYGGGGAGGKAAGSASTAAGTSGGVDGGHGGEQGSGNYTSKAGHGQNGKRGALTAWGGGANSQYRSWIYQGTRHTYDETGGSGGRGAYFGGGGGGGAVQQMGGGGGGGPTILTSNGEVVLIASGGGGGGGGPAGIFGCTCGVGGAGGGGGGPDGGGGGGGNIYSGKCYFSDSSISGVIENITVGVAGSGAGSGKAGTVGNGTLNVPGNGGDGGTNFGFKSYSSTNFGDNYCLGGRYERDTTGSRGGQGATSISWGGTNIFKCSYNLPANGGGGGGAAQITIGEIDVTPGETLYFEVGAGGGTQASAGKDGNVGKVTRIRRGSASGTVIAEALGGNAGKYSKEEDVESEGGARLSKRVLVMVNNVENNKGNWMNKTFTGGYGGNNGVLASATSNKGFGGAGGNIQNMKGESVSGGNGGNSVKKGGDADSKNYGAGGGGGAGAQTAGDGFGAGGAGASGYIYIEYGGSNGGGGTSGEYVSKTIYNIKAGTEIPITVGEGGKSGSGLNDDGNTVYYDGNGKESSFGDYLKARGGFKGQNGLTKETHGGITMMDENYANYSSDDSASVHGHGGSSIGGGIGGYMEYIYQNPDNTYATTIKSRDGTIAGPPLGGCGGNMSAAGNCNAASSGANGKPGIFGGGGGGGAVVEGVGGLGGYGGRGVVIIEYKSTAM